MTPELQEALKMWWYMKARMGMTASELIESLLVSLRNSGFKIVPMSDDEK